MCKNDLQEHDPYLNGLNLKQRHHYKYKSNTSSDLCEYTLRHQTWSASDIVNIKTLIIKRLKKIIKKKKAQKKKINPYRKWKLTNLGDVVYEKDINIKKLNTLIFSDWERERI